MLEDLAAHFKIKTQVSASQKLQKVIYPVHVFSVILTCNFDFSFIHMFKGLAVSTKKNSVCMSRKLVNFLHS